MDTYQDGGSVPSFQSEVLTGNFQQPQQEQLGSGRASNEAQLAPWPAALCNNPAKSWLGLDGSKDEEDRSKGGMSVAPISSGAALLLQ